MGAHFFHGSPNINVLPMLIIKLQHDIPFAAHLYTKRPPRPEAQTSPLEDEATDVTRLGDEEGRN